MAQNIKINGVTYNSVSSLSIPLDAGGDNAVFPDTSDATATAGDIAEGKTAYVDGSKVTGTAAGGGTPVSVPRKDVNFYDYEGTRVASYTIAEAQALAALPTQPTHSGLTGQGWNYTLAQVNAADRPMDVGAMYITDDSKTRLYITIPTALRKAIPLYFSQTVSNGVTINWGDGSNTQTVSGTGVKNITHTYSEPGDYIISLAVTSGTMGVGDPASALTVFGGTNVGYINMLQKIEIGSNVTSIGNYALGYSSIQSITIPNGVSSVGKNVFQYCRGLNLVVIPNSVSSIGGSAFSNCSQLDVVIIPEGVMSIIDSFVFQSCSRLNSLIIPDSVTSIGASAFLACLSLSSLVIPSNVTSIGAGAFSACSFVKEYHFLPTTPPTLANSNAFNAIATDCVIHVPAASLNAYKTATNWAGQASKMVGE